MTLGFNWRDFFGKPPSDEDDTLPMRGASGRFTSSPRTKREAHNQASIKTQLGVYIARTPFEQRKAETEAQIAALRAQAVRE